MSQLKEVDSFMLPPKKRISFREKYYNSLTLPIKKRMLREIMYEEEMDKKRKIQENISSEPPQLARLNHNLKKKIEDIGGYDVKMVIEKKLFNSDLRSNNNRFSIPENKISKGAKDFLKPQEVELLGARAPDDKLEGICVMVLDPNLNQFDLVLKRWPMRSSFVYNLTHNWNDIVRRNNLQLNDSVQLWSFRRLDDQLGFALVKL